MCAFGRVEDAVEFALKAQSKLVKADWMDDLLHLVPGRVEMDPEDLKEILFRGLRVRMGIHKGKPIVEKDPTTGRYDYFGPVVNRAARVSGQAAGGQIVISNAVWMSIKDKLDTFSTKVWFKLLGAVSLKGMDEPEVIRSILPFNLRNRKFPDVKVLIDHGGIAQLVEKDEPTSTSDLQKQIHSVLERHRSLKNIKDGLQGKIQYEMKMKAMEAVALEKDNIIDFLKRKITNPSKYASKEVEIVMQKYEEMKLHYNDMENAYSSYAEVFEKSNFDTALKELYEIQGKDCEKEVEEYTDIWASEKSKYENELEHMEHSLKLKDRRIMDLKSYLKAAKRLHAKKHTSPLKKRFSDLKYLAKRKERMKPPEKKEYKPVEKTVVDMKNVTQNPTPIKRDNTEIITPQQMKTLMKVKFGSLNKEKPRSMTPNASRRSSIVSLRPVITSAAVANPYISMDRTVEGRFVDTQQRPSVTSLSEITHILRDAIKEAVGSSNELKDLNWESFLSGATQNAFENLPTINTNDPVIYTPQTTITVFDEKTSQHIHISKDALRKWGVANAARFIAEQRFDPNKFFNTSQIISTEHLFDPKVEKEYTKQSYSRMLENYARPHTQSSAITLNIIHQWEPLGSPFRKVRVKPSSQDSEKIVQEIQKSFNRSSLPKMSPPAPHPTKTSTSHSVSLPRLNEADQKLSEHYSDLFEGYREEKRESILRVLQDGKRSRASSSKLSTH